LTGISKSTVSKLCKETDERAGAFLDRPLSGGDWPYLWLDATYVRQREGGRVVSVAAIIAMAADAEGRRQIVGLHIGPSEAETFWAAFLWSVVKRGLTLELLVPERGGDGSGPAAASTQEASQPERRSGGMGQADVAPSVPPPLGAEGRWTGMGEVGVAPSVPPPLGAEGRRGFAASVAGPRSDSRRGLVSAMC
jgi:hypothetical protein